MFIVDYEVAAEISKATTRAEQDRMSISVKDKCQKFRRHEAASVETATQTHDVSSHQRFWQKKETQWLRKALSSRFSGWACRPVLCLLTRWSTMSDHKCPKLRSENGSDSDLNMSLLHFLPDLDYYYLRPVGLIEWARCLFFLFGQGMDIGG
jgi:hypothetical protein